MGLRFRMKYKHRLKLKLRQKLRHEPKPRPMYGLKPILRHNLKEMIRGSSQIKSVEQKY